ncbi:CPBP family glutamic-type intramembrane protease [Miltoncostaea marina]|uniref:CPBP family glutamic-type intramembrane protease n=1 Tax=Miltoncostaea marina TaxID=2843215 RepID=UPI001C3D252A|nr:CPBP family glutamic-type intramembrane protease [Miltoncostaea marina]
MSTLDAPSPPPPPAPPPGPGRPDAPGPAFGWRVAAPLLAVVAAFAIAIVAAGVLTATPMSDDSLGAVVTVATSALLLAFGWLLWRRLPAGERRAAVGGPGGVAPVGLGVAVGLALLVGAAIVVATGAAIDPTVERRLEDLEIVGSEPWHLALLVVSLVVLAPLGEELLFRGLLLRGLLARLRFWPAALLTSLAFGAAHFDAYYIWPRAISLVATGLVLALVYRRWGYRSAVAAHATVNAVAAVALVVEKTA